MDCFLDEVAAAVARDGLLTPGEPVLVALSGGPDSVVLLHALMRLGYPVVAAHLDHGLRPTSAAEADEVARRCAGWGVPLELRAVAVGRGEQAARDARRAFLMEVARSRGLRAIALAHHADDQAETLLFRLARGTGPAGLGGMAPLRVEDGLRWIRPLLGFERLRLEAQRAAWGLPAVQDPSNQDVAFARNRVRHEVLPALRQVNLAAVPHLAALAERMRDEAAEQQARARRLAAFALLQPAPGLVELDRATLDALPPAAAAWLLREAAARVGAELDADALALCRAWAATHTPGSGRSSGAPLFARARMAAPFPGANPGPRAADLPGGLSVTATQQALVLRRGLRVPPPVPMTPTGEQRTSPWGWRITAQAPGDRHPDRILNVRLPVQAMPHDMVWRCPREGDRFRPHDSARDQSLRGFLTRNGIPAHRQETLLVLASGERVAWVVGMKQGGLAPALTDDLHSVEMQATAGFPV